MEAHGSGTPGRVSTNLPYTGDRGGFILSGGPDSALAAHIAHLAYPQITWRAFHFTYGQRAIPELACANLQAQHLEVPLTVIELPPGLLTSTMTQREEDRASEDLEPTFVPGRNDIFISMVAARLYHRGEGIHIVGGWNQEDSSGYPDCREFYMDVKASSLNLAFDCDVRIHSPVINMRKSHIIEGLRSFHIDPSTTWSCYTPLFIKEEGTSAGRWEPCGSCVSCLLRAKGFSEAQMDDPLTHITS